MNTYICYVTLHLRDDAHSGALLCYRNRAEIIVLLCKQKPYPVFQVFIPAQQLTSMVWTYNVASVGSYKTQPQLAATKRRSQDHRGQTSKSLFLFFIAGISFTS